LSTAGMVCPVGDQGTTAEDADLSLRCWEFHDLLFHTRSREGRHDAALGATYPLAGHVEPPPVLKPSPRSEVIDLHRPDLDSLQRHDPPFALIQERRRSERHYAVEPITVRQLGEFLFRVARVTQQQETTNDQWPMTNVGVIGHWSFVIGDWYEAGANLAGFGAGKL